MEPKQPNINTQKKKSSIPSLGKPKFAIFTTQKPQSEGGKGSGGEQSVRGRDVLSECRACNGLWIQIFDPVSFITISCPHKPLRTQHSLNQPPPPPTITTGPGRNWMERENCATGGEGGWGV